MMKQAEKDHRRLRVRIHGPSNPRRGRVWIGFGFELFREPLDHPDPAYWVLNIDLLLIMLQFEYSYHGGGV